MSYWEGASRHDRVVFKFALVAKSRLEEASRVLRRVLGDIDLAAKVTQIKETLQREGRPSMRDLRGRVRAVADRVGRDRIVGVSAVRRDQRDLRLLQRAGRRPDSPRATRSSLR
jgi:hypothetical protein